MGAATYIFANPGQIVRLIEQTLDGYGDRTDGYVPVVQSVVFPDLTNAAGYPRQMSRIDVGLYAHGIQLPTGVDSLGTYVISVYYQESGLSKWDAFAINVARPFGNTIVTPA
jgi:hypothetical protein